DVHARARETVLQLVGPDAVEGERDDPAANGAEVAQRHALDIAEPGPQALSERGDTFPDRVDAPAQCVVDRGREADLRRVGLLPLLEAKRVGPELVAVRLDPVRGAHVEERRLETDEEPRPDVEEA